MASNLETLVTVFGGSGFLGRHVVRARWPSATIASGSRCGGRNWPGTCSRSARVGQIHAVQANLRYPASVEAAMRDSPRRHQPGRHPGRERRADLRRRAGARAPRPVAQGGQPPSGARMVHVSAIGADENSPSRYARSKAAGEKAVLAAVPSATILRPSVVFGPEDQFTNRFAALARMSPVLPLIGGGVTRMQPVYVGDVATAVADAVDGKTRPGAIYELGGPEVLTMREIMEIILAHHRAQAHAGAAAVRAGQTAGAVPAIRAGPAEADAGPGRRCCAADNVVSDAAKAAGLTLEGLGITPDSMEAIAPQYLWRFRNAGQFPRKGA